MGCVNISLLKIVGYICGYLLASKAYISYVNQVFDFAVYYFHVFNFCGFSQPRKFIRSNKCSIMSKDTGYPSRHILMRAMVSS